VGPRYNEPGGKDIPDLALLAALRHRSLQYLTSSQFKAHLRRQVKGRPHRTQSLEGKKGLRYALRGVDKGGAGQGRKG